MIKIKFIQFYSNLNKPEKRDFKKFVSSGYFNKGRDYSVFLYAVEKNMQIAANTGEIIKLISTQTSFTRRTIWNRLHDLTSLADQYIAIKEINKNELLFSNLVSTYHINKFEYGLFTQKVNLSRKKFAKTKKKLDTNYYYYQLLQQLGNSYIFQNKTEPYVSNLTEQVIYHSAGYIINHYLHLIELLQQGNMTEKDLTEKGLNFLTDNNTESLLHTLKENYSDLFCQVSFHYNIYKAFLHKNDASYYHTSLEFFELVSKTADDTYRSLFYQLLINYCIERTNNNEPEYYNELFHLYNRKLNEGLFQDLQVGNFPINNFRDYIFVALQLGKLDWIKWFIEKYSHHLPNNVRDDEINLSYGIVYYHESDNKNALKFLNNVAGDNYIHYMDSKYYKLRLYFETESYEEAILEIDNYKHYLRAHKEIPDTFAKPYKMFIKEYSTLLNSKLYNKPEDATLLAEQIKARAITPRRRWILNKLQEVIKKH